uniref:Uncharacterized protein n=1 Tax=Plectus sambesii TaxID=2011161 RepID=A0A914WCN6_9BILA
MVEGTDRDRTRNRISLRVSTDGENWRNFLKSMEKHGKEHTKKVKDSWKSYYLDWKKACREIKDLLEKKRGEAFWLIEKKINKDTGYEEAVLMGVSKKIDGISTKSTGSKRTNRFLNLDGQQQHHAVEAEREHTQPPIAEDDWDEDQ